MFLLLLFFSDTTECLGSAVVNCVLAKLPFLFELHNHKLSERRVACRGCTRRDLSVECSLTLVQWLKRCCTPFATRPTVLQAAPNVAGCSCHRLLGSRLGSATTGCWAGHDEPGELDERDAKPRRASRMQLVAWASRLRPVVDVWQLQLHFTLNSTQLDFNLMLIESL